MQATPGHGAVPVGAEGFLKGAGEQSSTPGVGKEGGAESSGLRGTGL